MLKWRKSGIDVAYFGIYLNHFALKPAQNNPNMVNREYTCCVMPSASSVPDILGDVILLHENVSPPPGFVVEVKVNQSTWSELPSLSAAFWPIGGLSVGSFQFRQSRVFDFQGSSS